MIPPLLAFAVVLAACATGASSSSSVAPDPTSPPPGDPAPAITASCGAVVFADATHPVPPANPLDDDARAAIDQAAASIGAEADFFGAYEWFIADRTDTRLILFGAPLAPPLPGSPPYATASFARAGDAWQPEGWGQCRIELDAPGFGPAAWVLDPDIEPHPDATELNLLINEQNCASGEAPVGREVVPVIAADADTVTINVLVEPVAGDAACPSNPWHRVTVDLGEPLGDRSVFDGHTYPSLQRTWPPSPTSVDSFGREE